MSWQPVFEIFAPPCDINFQAVGIGSMVLENRNIDAGQHVTIPLPDFKTGDPLTYTISQRSTGVVLVQGHENGPENTGTSTNENVGSQVYIVEAMSDCTPVGPSLGRPKSGFRVIPTAGCHVGTEITLAIRNPTIQSRKTITGLSAFIIYGSASDFTFPLEYELTPGMGTPVRGTINSGEFVTIRTDCVNPPEITVEPLPTPPTPPEPIPPPVSAPAPEPKKRNWLWIILGILLILAIIIGAALWWRQRGKTSSKGTQGATSGPPSRPPLASSGLPQGQSSPLAPRQIQSLPRS